MTDLSKLALEYAPPADDLKELISSFYLFRVNNEPGEAGAQLERADRAQFRFLLEGGGSWEFCDGKTMGAAPITIIGPTTGPSTGRFEGPIEIFGAGLQPAGWGSLMGIEGDSHTDRLIDATAIFGSGILAVHAALKAAETMDAKVAIGNEFTRKLLDRADPAPFWFTRLVDRWLSSASSPDIDELIAESGLSKRQVERMTKRFYGSPPKLLARKYRALRAASALIRHEAGTEDLLEDGFYDQSHLIRELKQFTGITPGQMHDAPPELNQEIAAGRKKLTGMVSKLISDT